MTKEFLKDQIQRESLPHLCIVFVRAWGSQTEALGGTSMARQLPRLSVVSGVTALALLAGGVLVGTPARAIARPAPAGPSLISLSNERVLTFPVSDDSSAARVSPLRATDGSSYTSRALDSVNRNRIQLGLTGSISELSSLVSSTGGRRVHLQQSISGVPVMGGEAVVDLTLSGETRAIVSDFLPGAGPKNLVPRITSAQAFDFYIRSVARTGSHRTTICSSSTAATKTSPRSWTRPRAWAAAFT